MTRIDPYSVAIGRAVRGAIAQAGLNQVEAAEILGVSTRSLSRRVNGDLPFTWPEVARIAEAAGITSADLAATADRIVKPAAV